MTFDLLEKRNGVIENEKKKIKPTPEFPTPSWPVYRIFQNTRLTDFDNWKYFKDFTLENQFLVEIAWFFLKKPTVHFSSPNNRKNAEHNEF